MEEVEQATNLIKKKKEVTPKRKVIEQDSAEKKMKVEQESETESKVENEGEKKQRYKHPLIKICENCHLYSSEFKFIRSIIYDEEHSKIIIKIRWNDESMDSITFQCSKEDKKTVEDKILGYVKMYRE